MITIISPAKSVNFKEPAPTQTFTSPDFLSQSKQLITILRGYSVSDIRELMSVSERIAELNVTRNKEFSLPFNLENAKQALFAFTGDVYRHMRISTYTEDTLAFAQSNLRILSGLYGVLRPLDLIQAYRLEMKTRLSTRKGEDLYQYWGAQITNHLNKDLQSDSSPVLINLASKEYARAVDFTAIKAPVITVDFKEVENGKSRVIAIFAKWARGMMADYIIQNKMTDPDDIKTFNLSDYSFSKGDSEDSRWVFTRPRPE